MNLFSLLWDTLKTNLVEVIGFIITIIGGITALVQWNKSIKTNRAKYVKDLLFRVMDDEHIKEFQHIADYTNDNWYAESFHRDSNYEFATTVDRTLFTYNYICYLKDTHEINNKELKIFRYSLLSLAHDKNLYYYFLDLYQYSIFSGKKFPFNHYLKFCIKNKCISKDIKNEKYYYYYLCKESNMNGNHINLQIPKEIETVIDLSQEHLFIHTISRCKNCKHFINNECKLNISNKNHYWVGENPRCESFNFDNTNWSKEKNYL